MRIAIAGAGAMGGRFGYMLQNSGQEVFYIDSWQENIDKMKTDGLTIDDNGQERKIPVKAYHAKQIGEEKADLIILFVKSMQLPEMLRDLKPIITKETKVICLLNGLGHVKTIEQYIPRPNIYVGVTLWTARMLGPAHVHLSGDGNIELQNIDPEMEEEAKKIADIFNAAGLKAKYSQNVLYSIWKKACINGAMNATCAILDCNLAQFNQIPHADIYIRNLLNEFVWAAKTEDQVELDAEEVFTVLKQTFDPSRQGLHYPSMHQDLVQNHRLTEVDYLNGYVWKLGREKGVSTPYCEMITILTHGKETILGIS
ncbi:2-dehydropantoate 2-reductase [Clostridiales bacterium COT073_COT-073]|nr:2-dehydropantoate 2-reductase [Clostridiales bacterium COT073_COT-073]